MRKQYYLKPSPRGLLAWDVDRLVALTADFPVRDLPLESVRELDEPHWYGAEGDVPTVRSVAEHAGLIEEADLAHPVILSAEGRVMDGMHRIAKAWLAGRASVPAVRFEADPSPDYVGVDPEDLPYDE
ncbi:MAG: hypothetical protein Q8W51_01555 [Candidatus Palauibacterales bacterium]|jgi:hypothetical protein|nr:hypothetical protein [Candidatus Palauibacterales bacterium]MDP2528406.1 hypothetical protein [Candidatus Palauibacterales bacterium]MDP2584992.1 hypothetical protein [Candidatus Palauibacterales bacterium]